MKFLLFILLLSGCIVEKNGSNTLTYVAVKERQKYEGVYYFDNNSTFEIQSNELDEMFIYTTGQSVKTINKDGSLAFHPTISGNRLREVNGKLFWSNTISYSTTNNMRNDSTNSVLTGSKLTEYYFEFISGNPTLKIIIYDNNSIVVNRSIDELN